jgi:hypothetical protein
MNIEDRIRDALTARAELANDSRGVLGYQRQARSGVRRAGPLLAGAASVIAILLALTLGIGSTDPISRSGSSSPRQASAAHGPSYGQVSSSDPNKPNYPADWAFANVEAAQRAVAFNLIVPDTGPVNPSNLTGIYSQPGGAVVFDYPPISKPSSYLRQNYIEIYESPWDPSRKPADVYEAMAKGDDNPTESLTTIAGVPALVVGAHSPADDEKANSAFVRLVVGDVELQLSGGEDLSLLTGIAESMAKSSN